MTAGTPPVRKIAPGARQLMAEVEALRAFGEERAVKVLEIDVGTLSMLLERVTPGTTLAASASEDEAVRVVAGLLSAGWPPVPNASAATPLVHLRSALDAPALARARSMFSELLADSPPPVLLHGDLHYENILVSDRAGHLLIDPKGFIGDPAFDIGYLVSRPMPSARDALPLAQAIDRRLAFLPDAVGLDAQRVASFAYVAAALSVAWAREDHDPNVTLFEHAMRTLQESAIG
jgi:streptomycin 6-kinase